MINGTEGIPHNGDDVMNKTDTKAETAYFANLDIGAPLKKAGIVFPQGEPKAVPLIWVEDFEKDPNFAKVEATKKLIPSECEKLRTKELKKATERRDKWRKERAAGKRAVTNAPPAPEPKEESK